MGALAASIASHVPSGLLSVGGEIIRRASRLEDELKELLRHSGRAPEQKQGAAGEQTKERFLRAYERLKSELLDDRAFSFTEGTGQWVAKMLDYNVPGGKLNRGLSVIDSYMLLREGTEVDDKDFYLACVLGWCVEWFQASALVLDDITDNAYTRRDNLCWYKLPTVGLSAINDGVLLKCHVQAIIKRYFKEKFYFLDLMELWNEIGLQTAMGQMLDLITTHTGAKDLARYRIQGYRRIVKYKTSYYSFYLPVACALLLNGAKVSDYVELKNVLIEMGVYFQIQDDYLDCFGDPEVIGKMIDYNVPGGKLNRGMSVVDSYLLLKQGSEVTEDEFFLACVLGWCMEWFEACALLLDDIMDGSYTRRDRICWYKRPEVGLEGINDGILLKCHIARLIKKYFREKPYYTDIAELWTGVALQTSHGQMLDLISTRSGADNLTKYSIEGYQRIVKYKTSYYSFYLPVASALLLTGAKPDNFSGLRDILVEMGVYFQAQDDYLDCFADPNTTGKIGTDIEDHKCSWLLVQALGHADCNQIEVLQNCYGKKDSSSVSKVKSTYSVLDLKGIFSEFENRAYKNLVTSIEAQQDRAVQEILKSFLKKIHRRKK